MPLLTRIRRQAPFAITVAVTIGLAACASSQRIAGPYGTERLDGAGPGPVQTGPVYNAPGLASEPGAGVFASSPVTSQALPPIEPRYGALPLPDGTPAAPAIEPLPAPGPEPLRQPPTLSGGGRVATLGAEATGSGPRPANSRDGMIGQWTARESTGTTCKIQLSSVPALDRYKANAGGCANKDLQKATAWDFQDGDVYLYQPGGGVVARLKASDGSAMNGVVAKSGATLSLSR